MNNIDLIPWQLWGCKFIKIRAHDKLPCEKWTNSINQYSAMEIIPWIKSGNNYAVIPFATNDLAVLDADDCNALKPFVDALYATAEDNNNFEVKTGRASGLGRQYYFIVDPVDGYELPMHKLHFVRGDEDAGDFRAPGTIAYNVAPESIHHSGNRYEVISDYPIMRIPSNAIFKGIEAMECKGWSCYWDEDKKPVKIDCKASDNIATNDTHNRLTADKDYKHWENAPYVWDILKPLNARSRDGEIEGIHPIHGSDTGTNLTCGAHCWYCRRHGVGGDAIKAVAVANGVIACEDAGKPLRGKAWRDTMDVIESKYPSWGDEINESMTNRKTAGILDYRKLMAERLKRFMSMDGD